MVKPRRAQSAAWIAAPIIAPMVALLCCLLAPPVLAECHNLQPSRAVPPAAADQWALASFNLWRLRDTSKDAPFDKPLTRRTYEARLDALADYLIHSLKSPALVAVQEVENRAILEDLAGRIRGADGPSYHALLLEGNDPSGMDVGLLYRAPVKVGPAQALFADLRYDRHALFARPPLVVPVTAPLSFKLVIVHLRSARDLGKKDWVAEKRRRQAQRLAGWLKQQKGTRLVVVGDFNSGPGDGLFSEPWRVLETAGLYNSASRLRDGERYSYLYRCRKEAPDHILLSPALEKHLRAVAVSRGNAGHYRALYRSQGTKVVSDHDVPVVYFGN